MAQGGGVLVLGDPGPRDIINALTAPKGVSLDGFLLFVPGPHGGDFDVDNFASHPAVHGVSAYATNWGGSLQVSSPAVPLAFTGSQVYGDLDGEFDQDPGEPTGPFTVAAACELGPAGLIRMAVLGDNPFQDDCLEQRNNAPLARALLRWLTAAREASPWRAYLPVTMRKR